MACTHAPQTHHAAHWNATRRAVQQDGIAIAPVQFVSALDAPALPPRQAPDAIQRALLPEDPAADPPTVLDPQSPRDAAFLRNDFVGNIRLGGGFVRTGDVGMEVRSRFIELGQESAYQAGATQWVDGLLDELSTPFGAIDAGDWIAPGPERVRFRGVHRDDGRDDVNLPRTSVRPAPLGDPKPDAKGKRWLLVPYVRSYYTHNAGWFIGQTWGTMSGARIEVLLALYDLQTGQPVWWQVAEGRTLSRTGSPSTAALDGYLLTAEEKAARELRSGFLR